MRSLTKSTALDTGVKRQLIVAIAEDVPEIYDNVKELFNLIKASDFYFHISCDLKIANILCGLQSHSS